MRTLYTMAVVGAALLSGCGTMGADTKATVYPDKVIYHVNEGDDQAVDALRNIKNHLAVNPKAKIVVVTHSNGVRFLKKGARDKNGNPFNVPVEELKERGVQFDLCEITLQHGCLSARGAHQVEARVTTVARAGDISESEALLALGRARGDGETK